MGGAETGLVSDKLRLSWYPLGEPGMGCSLEFPSAVTVSMWLVENKRWLGNCHSGPCESWVLKEACEGDAMRGGAEPLSPNSAV